MRRALSRAGATVLCCGALAVAATSFGFFKLPGPTAVPTYYLSPSGSDSNSGTTPATAWRTLARASAAALRPGDRLLLRGGSRFGGTLRLGADDAGRPVP